jgi:hypothetical protein
MSIGLNWQKVRIPLMERLALADMAERRGVSEEQMLSDVIRQAVKHDLAETDNQANEGRAVQDDR